MLLACSTRSQRLDSVGLASVLIFPDAAAAAVNYKCISIIAKSDGNLTAPRLSNDVAVATRLLAQLEVREELAGLYVRRVEVGLAACSC